MRSMMMIAVGVAACAMLVSIPAERQGEGAAGAVGEAANASVVLMQVDERRRLELVKQENSFSHFEPLGLELTFRVQLPAGQQLLEISQPTKVMAKDSQGNDLSKIEKNFMGQVEHVELVQSFGEAPDLFKFRLASPARSATTIDCKASLAATTYRGTEEVLLTLGKQLAPVEPRLLEGREVKAKLTGGGNMFGGGDGDDGMAVMFESPTIRAAIESIWVVRGDREIESNSSMWSGDSVTYYFDGKHEPGYVVKILLRTGISEVPVEIDLKQQALP